jgi:hypothetical protein
VHEGSRSRAQSGQLRGELEHYAYRDIAHHLQKIDRYTTLIAEQMVRRRPRGRVGVLSTSSCTRRRLRAQLLPAGGFATAPSASSSRCMNAYYVFLKFAKLWERQRR